MEERFANELRCDIALRLAALQMQQHALANNITQKVTVKVMEKECGLERFVPASILGNMKRKELRSLLAHFIKINNQQLSAQGQKRLSELQAKLSYLKLLGELPSFGGRCFNLTLHSSGTQMLVLAGPKYGVSQLSGTASGNVSVTTCRC